MLLLLSPVVYNFPSYIALYLSLSLSEIREFVFFCSGLADLVSRINNQIYGLAVNGAKYMMTWGEARVEMMLKERYWSYFSHV